MHKIDALYQTTSITMKIICVTVNSSYVIVIVATHLFSFFSLRPRVEGYQGMKALSAEVV